LLYRFWQLKAAGRLPDIPIFVDSPLAITATDVYSRHPTDHAHGTDLGEDVFGIARYVRAPEESKALSGRKGPMVLISASGMATGGRVLHHLKAFAPLPGSTILFAGYQAAATRGALMVEGAREIKIHGDYVKVNAEVVNMKNFSAHADAGEIVRWIKSAGRPPKRIFITHGEPVAADALRKRIQRDLGWDSEVPDYRDKVKLE